MFDARTLLAATAAVLVVGSASAATVTTDTMLFQPVDPATSVSPANPRTDFTGSVGTLFATDTAQTVTHLGFWDEGGDGFTEDHTISLYFSDDNGVTITSTVATATITAADSTSAQLVGGYRWVELDAPVVLNPQTPGVSDPNGALDWYILQGNVVENGDPFGDSEGEGTSYIVNDAIHGTNANSPDSAYFDARFNNTGFGGSAATYVGPNLAVIPEPGSLALLGLGGLMFARRRRA